MAGLQESGAISGRSGAEKNESTLSLSSPSHKCKHTRRMRLFTRDQVRLSTRPAGQAQKGLPVPPVSASELAEQRARERERERERERDRKRNFPPFCLPPIDLWPGLRRHPLVPIFHIPPPPSGACLMRLACGPARRILDGLLWRLVPVGIKLDCATERTHKGQGCRSWLARESPSVFASLARLSLAWVPLCWRWCRPRLCPERARAEKRSRERWFQWCARRDLSS